MNAIRNLMQSYPFRTGPLPTGLELLLSRPELYEIDEAHANQVIAQYSSNDPREFAARLARMMPFDANPVGYVEMLFGSPTRVSSFGLRYFSDFAKAVFSHPELEQVWVDLKQRSLTAEEKAMWQTGESSSEQGALLKGVLDRIKEVERTGQKPIVIVDVDDTILLTPLRQAAIFAEYAYRHEVDPLKDIRPRHFSGYGYREALVHQMGLGEDWVDKNRELKDFWSQRFFENPYLLLDMPTPGSAEYLQRLQIVGAFLVYLTGRDGANMREGTVAALRAHQFPDPKEDGATLMMKGESSRDLSTPEMDESTRRAAVRKSDLDYKLGVIQKVQEMGEVVAVFDNESSTANLFLEQLPCATILRVDTIQSRSFPLKEGVRLVSGFL